MGSCGCKFAFGVIAIGGDLARLTTTLERKHVTRTNEIRVLSFGLGIDSGLSDLWHAVEI